MRRLVTLLCLSVLPFTAGAADTIRWILYPSFPPAQIESGPFAGEGIVDHQVAWMLSRLDGFDNIIIKATNARGFHEIMARDGECAVDVFRTPERQEIALFSRVALVHQPPGLLIRSDRLAALSPARAAGGAVDLGRLAEITGLSGAVAADRNFGPEVTSFLASEAAAPTPVTSVAQALEMMSRGRVDYTFGYSAEGNYYRQVLDPTADVTFVPIAGSPPLIRAYIACSKGPLGAKAIREIDRLLDQSGGSPAFLAASRRWFDPEEYRQIEDPSNWEPSTSPR